MPATLEGKVIRIPLNQSASDPALDVLSGEKLVLWKGTEAHIQSSLFSSTPSADTFISDISDVVDVHLVVRKHNSHGTVLLSKHLTSGFSTAADYDGWVDLSSAHFDLELNSVDTNQTVPSSGTLPIFYTIKVSTVDTSYLGAYGYGELTDIGVTGIADPAPENFFSVYVDGDNVIQNPVLDFTGVTVNGLISGALLTALNLKANIASPTFTGTVGGITKSMVGLSNVDNTSDANKPISTAEQTALNLKANLASPTFTGNPVAPTQTAGNNSTRLATTAYTDNAIATLIASAPGVLDTLDEIAAALGDDANFAATMTTLLAGKQPLNTNLTAIAGLTSIADRLPYFTGSGTATLATFTTFARTILDDTNAGVTRVTLGLVPSTTNFVLYVSSAGNDSNDGLTWSQAKLTYEAAYTLATAAGGGIIYVAAGIFTPTGTITWVPNIVTIGAGRNLTTIQAPNNTNLFSVTSNTYSITFENIRLAGAGGATGGDIISIGSGTGSLSQSNFRNVYFTQPKSDKHIIYAPDVNNFIENKFNTNCEFHSSSSSGTVPLVYVVSSNNGISLNTFEDCRVSQTWYYAFWFESTGTGYVNGNEFRRINGEQTNGGFLRDLSSNNTLVEDVIGFDFGSDPTTQDWIYSGASSTTNKASINFTIRRCQILGRTLGSSLVDVRLQSGKSSGVTIDNFDDGQLVTAPTIDVGNNAQVNIINCRLAPTLQNVSATTFVRDPNGNTWGGDTILARLSAGVMGVGGSAILVASNIGSTVQAYDADLTTWAGITPSAAVQTMLGAFTTANVNSATTDDDFLTITGTQTGISNKTFVAPVLGAATGTSLTLSGSFSTTAGNVNIAAANSLIFTGNSKIQSATNGLFTLLNNGGTDFTGLNFGGTTNSFWRIGRDVVNGITLQSAAGTTTWNDASTANSGTVASRYTFGIAAPTLSSTGTSVTYTKAATVSIGGAPAAGTNVTIGTAWALDVIAGNVNFGGSLTLGTALAVTSGGNGLSTATTGGIRYASATNTLSELAANSTATKKFLSMTSSVPSWAQPAATDITGLATSATTDTTNAANISSGRLANARLPLGTQVYDLALGLAANFDERQAYADNGITAIIEWGESATEVTNGVRLSGTHLFDSDGSYYSPVVSWDTDGNITSSGSVSIQGIQTLLVTKTGNYTVTYADHFILVDSTAATRTITLPGAAAAGGKEFIIKDWKGTAASNNITINTSSSQTIDGASTKVLTTAYQSISVVSDGANWSIF